jgi:transcription antitermination factor NusG
MEKKWYVVHTYSGYEQKVKEGLEERIKTNGMQGHFAEIIVPSEVIMERVKGQAKKSQRTIFPGYIIVQMDMNEDTWYLVRNTPKVTGFVGYGMKPTPLPDDEIKDPGRKGEDKAEDSLRQRRQRQGDRGAFLQFYGKRGRDQARKGEGESASQHFRKDNTRRAGFYADRKNVKEL